QPSNAVVAFRDQLEEATAAARATRGTGGQPAPVAATTTAPAEPTGTTTVLLSEQLLLDPQPQPFEPVDDNPAGVEPMADTPGSRCGPRPLTVVPGGVEYPERSSPVPGSMRWVVSASGIG